MKRWLACLLALLCLLSAIPALAAQGEVRTTVLIYMSGSDLERVDGSATADIEEMLRANVPVDGPLNVLVETGGSKKWQLDAYPGKKTCLYRISGDDCQMLETMDKRNMGDPDTLSDFLKYGRENYPAERYILVLWGHGDGPTGGVCFDELFRDDSLMLDEIAASLDDAAQAGQRIDAVIFDACMMNCVDLLYQLGDRTDYIVSSQESTLGSGGRYDLWLSGMASAPETDTLEICARFAACYVSTGKHGRFSQTTTMSVLDSAAAPALLRATEALYAQLNTALDSQEDAILAAVSGLVSFGELDGGPPSGLMDALQLCDALEPFAPQACAALRSAVEQAVPFHADSGALENATCGLTLFLPCAQQTWPGELYDWYQPLSDGSSYAQLIVRMARAQKGDMASSFRSFLQDAFTGDSESDAVDDAPAADVHHIWQGLGASGSAASGGSSAVDAHHIWQGLGASDSAASSGSSYVDAHHIWQGLGASDSAASSANANAITGGNHPGGASTSNAVGLIENIWQKLNPAA